MLYTIYPFASNNITKVKMMNRGLQSKTIKFSAVCLLAISGIDYHLVGCKVLASMQLSRLGVA